MGLDLGGGGGGGGGDGVGHLLTNPYLTGADDIHEIVSIHGIRSNEVIHYRLSWG